MDMLYVAQFIFKRPPDTNVALLIVGNYAK